MMKVIYIYDVYDNMIQTKDGEINLPLALDENGQAIVDFLGNPVYDYYGKLITGIKTPEEIKNYNKQYNFLNEGKMNYYDDVVEPTGTTGNISPYSNTPGWNVPLTQEEQRQLKNHQLLQQYQNDIDPLNEDNDDEQIESDIILKVIDPTANENYSYNLVTTKKDKNKNVWDDQGNPVIQDGKIVLEPHTDDRGNHLKDNFGNKIYLDRNLQQCILLNSKNEKAYLDKFEKYAKKQDNLKEQLIKRLVGAKNYEKFAGDIKDEHVKATSLTNFNNDMLTPEKLNELKKVLEGDPDAKINIHELPPIFTALDVENFQKWFLNILIY